MFGMNEAEMAAKTHPPAQRQKKEPHVGIFWVVSGKPLIDSMALGEAEDYGDFRTYPRSHIDVWEQWRLSGRVPGDVEYEEPPRGRVMFNKKAGRFTFLADRCILRDKNMVSTIMSAMNLPNKSTDKGTHDHYRCSACPPARLD